MKHSEQPNYKEFLEAKRLTNIERRKTPEFWIAKLLRSLKRCRTNPTRSNADQSLRAAIRLGILPKADTQKCAECGTQARDHHHPDYRYALWVIPLCRSCHSMLHHMKRKEMEDAAHPWQ